MIHMQNVKMVEVKQLGTVATNATNTDSFDRRGFHYATVVLINGPAAATNVSASFSTLALQESDTDVSSNYTSVTGAVGGTNATNGFTIPINNSTSAGFAVMWQVDLRKRKRYLRVQSTPSAVASNQGQYGVIAILSRAEIAPDTIAERLAGVGTNYAQVVV